MITVLFDLTDVENQKRNQRTTCTTCVLVTYFAQHLNVKCKRKYKIMINNLVTTGAEKRNCYISFTVTFPTCISISFARDLPSPPPHTHTRTRLAPLFHCFARDPLVRSGLMVAGGPGIGR